MTVHATVEGFAEDDMGFFSAECTCGAHIGPAPDEETLVDMAMDHVRVAVTMELQR